MIRCDESPVAAESVNAVLDRAAERWPTQDAVITDSVRVTYQDLRERAERLAGGFVGAGLAPGDRIAACLPNERLGETVHALVELEAAQTTSERELLEGCRAELARYKVPMRIVVVDALARNALGKPDQRAARARLMDG